MGGRFFWSALLLIALNLVVGGLTYRYLQRVDANYTRLINESVPFLNGMRAVTAQSARVYSTMVELTQAKNPGEIARLRDELTSMRKVTDLIFSSPLNTRAVPEELKPIFEDIRETRRTGVARRDQLVQLVEAGRTAEAEEFLRLQLLPAQRVYLDKLDAFCVRYEATIASLARDLTDDNFQNRTMLFGLAAIPLILSVGLFLAALVSVLVPLNLLVRSAEIDRGLVRKAETKGGEPGAES